MNANKPDIKASAEVVLPPKKLKDQAAPIAPIIPKPFPINQNPPKPQHGRLPVPELAELNKARRAIRLARRLNSKGFWDAAEQENDPTKRYALYEKCIDAAIAEGNIEVVWRAAERMIELYDVDAASFRTKIQKRLPKGAPPAPVTSPPPPAMEMDNEFRGLTLKSGREIQSNQLIAPTRDEVRRLFPAKPEEALKTFVLRRGGQSDPEGLFTINQDKSFDGPAIVVHPSGHLKALLSYADAKRSGMLRCWNEDGELILLSEYRNGNKFGVTCFCRNGLPILIEERDANQKATQYLVVNSGGTLKTLSPDAATPAQLGEMHSAEADLRHFEAELLESERSWRRSFVEWWSKNQNQILELKRVIESATDPKVRDAARKELEELLAKLRTANTDNANKLFERVPVNPIRRVTNVPRSTLYLSDLKESKIEVLRYQGKAVFGKGMISAEEKLIIGGLESPKGIFPHPKPNGRSSVTYDLKGAKFKYFEAEVGVSEQRNIPGNPKQSYQFSPLTFEVWGDGKMLWRSAEVVPGSQPQPCKIVLPELSQLELVVHCRGHADFAWATWAEPRLTNASSVTANEKRPGQAESHSKSSWATWSEPTAEAKPAGQIPSDVEPSWTKMGQAIQSGPTKATITSAKIERLLLKSADLSALKRARLTCC